MRDANRMIVGCCLAIFAALMVVGVSSQGIARHLVQTAGVWPAVLLAMRGSPLARWAALPVFIFWFVIMSLIWLFLTGIAHIVSGHFPPIEIAMTILVGLAALVGGVSAVRVRQGRRRLPAAAIFIAMAAVQFALFAISVSTPISSDARLLAWLHR